MKQKVQVQIGQQLRGRDGCIATMPVQHSLGLGEDQTVIIRAVDGPQVGISLAWWRRIVGKN